MDSTTVNIQRQQRQELLERQKNMRRTAIYALIILYATGFIGMQTESLLSIFLLLVPFLLLLSLLAILLFQVWTPKFVTFLTIIYFASFSLEVLGANTGLLFGHYTYGQTLGFQILNVPVIIGVNWILMTYGAGMITNWIPVHWLTRCLSGAILMTGMDALIEPVAMRFDFWNWQDGMIPLQNFFSWFVISFIFMILYQKIRFHKHNKIASSIFILLFFFFLAFYLERIIF